MRRAHPKAASAARAARHLLAGIALVAWPTALRAEEVPLSLEQALDVTMRQNPELLAQRARTEAEAARAQAIKRTRWPRLSLASGWS
jgi:outer membrane protein TolC